MWVCGPHALIFGCNNKPLLIWDITGCLKYIESIISYWTTCWHFRSHLWYYSAIHVLRKWIIPSLFFFTRLEEYSRKKILVLNRSQTINRSHLISKVPESRLNVSLTFPEGGAVDLSPSRYSSALTGWRGPIIIIFPHHSVSLKKRHIFYTHWSLQMRLIKKKKEDFIWLY